MASAKTAQSFAPLLQDRNREFQNDADVDQSDDAGFLDIAPSSRS
ncbi:hypothetical protein N9Y42_03025 [Mariniblastus sp.]|nr:hypothetical protein [Mariniblastus sp.]